MKYDFLADLAALIESRKQASSQSSYTASLLHQGSGKCAQKFGEEAVEFAMAMVSESDDNITNEAADVLYHLLVALSAKNIPFDHVINVLQARTALSGHEEKAQRNK